MAATEADYEWLVSDLEEYFDSKILRSEWNTKTVTAEDGLDTLESDLNRMEVSLRSVETGLLDYLTQLANG